MKENLFLSIILMFLPFNSFAGEVTVHAEKGSWATFQKDSVEVKNGLRRMVGSYFSVELPIDLTNYSQSQLDSLKDKNCIKQDSDQRWIFVPRDICIDILPEDKQTVIYAFVLKNFDEIFPSYEATISPAEESNLKQQLYIQIHRPQLQMSANMNAADLLSESTSPWLWKMGSGANCFGTAIAAEMGTSSNYMDIYPFYDSLRRDFREIKDSKDWEFGDLISFEISGDGHAMVYIGTDFSTQKKIVYTKNGYISSPFQTMTYDDVFQLYNEYHIGAVHRY